MYLANRQEVSRKEGTVLAMNKADKDKLKQNTNKWWRKNFNWLSGLWPPTVIFSTVRLQSERGHSVVREGPYGVIRHPGYTAGIISNLATPLLLESWIALIPAAIVISGYIVRTALEDSFLQKNLPGYRDYILTVRYRLIPGVW